MRKKIKTWVKRTEALFVAAMMATLCFTGCSTTKSGNQSEQKVFSYDGVDVNLDEVWLYADISKAKYEVSYGSVFGDSLWTTKMSQDDDGNSITLEQYVKDNVIDQIKHVIVLNNKAEELGVSLSNSEIKKAKKSAKAFVGEEEGKEILKETGADEALVQKLYEENALASKVRQKMIEEADTNVTDEEARQTTIYRLVFPKVKTDDSTGEKTDMSKKEIQEQKAKADEAYKKLQAGTSIEDLAKEYEVTSTTDETFGEGESEEGKAFEKVVFAMKDGETTAVMDTDAGYVIAKLVALTDAEATEEKKSEIVQERQEKIYEEKYTEWTTDLEKDWNDEKDVNQDAMDKIVFSEATTEATTTASGETETTQEATTTASGETTQATTAAGTTEATTTASGETTQATTAAVTQKTTAVTEATTTAVTQETTATAEK